MRNLTLMNVIIIQLFCKRTVHAFNNLNIFKRFFYCNFISYKDEEKTTQSVQNNPGQKKTNTYKLCFSPETYHLCLYMKNIVKLHSEKKHIDCYKFNIL